MSVLGPDFSSDECQILNSRIREFKRTVTERLAQDKLGHLQDIEGQFFPNDFDAPGLIGTSARHARNQIHPVVEIIVKRLESRKQVNEFRQWELTQVEQLLDDLPSELEVKVRLALERCRLVQFGLPNYIRWMAADGEVQWTEDQLIQLQDQLRRNESQMLDSLKFEVAEFDRKFLQRLPTAARQTLQRRLGFSLDQLPAWRRTMPWTNFSQLWLPFEGKVKSPDEAYRRLSHLLDHRITEHSSYPLSQNLMERVPLSEMKREYGMSRYTPLEIETAARDLFERLRGPANSIADNKHLEQANYLAEIRLMEQWLRNETVNDLDDWDQMYRSTTNYHEEFGHIGELEDVRGRTPSKHLADYAFPTPRAVYLAKSMNRWIGLPADLHGTFAIELDLTDIQRNHLSQFWYKKLKADQLKWDEIRAMFPKLQKELETVLTPQQTVIGFQCVVAGWGPFPIMMHPDAAEDYGLSPEDRVALKSFAQTERARIEQNQLASVRRSYQTVIASLEPKTRQLLCEKVGLDPATLSMALAECNAPVNANRFPQRYYWFDEFYDQGRVSPPLEDTKTRSRKTLIKYGWVDEANKEP
ncbi:MAG: hypothetical protein JNL67_17930 [Planctomycetaceae bacterium]|nr:hypothetical protein [Planctomycetaceae bacterium]